MKRSIAFLLIFSVFVLVVSASLAEEFANYIVELGDQGRVQLTQVTEYSDEMGLQITDMPDGKWMCAVLTILDDAEMDTSAAFNLAKDIVTLDDYPVYQLAGRGVKLDMTAGKAWLVGDIVVIFDVPADYDLSRAVLKLNGTEVPLPPSEPAAG